MVSKYHKNDPIKEFTSSQAIVLPVIDNIDNIYILDCEEATASLDVQVEGNTGFAYKEVNYTKASVIAAINVAVESTKAKANNADSTLAKYIDELSEEQVLIFEANIVAA